MRRPELERRARIVFVAGWGPSLEQPSWAAGLGVRLQRAQVVSLEEAQGVASAGASFVGYPAVVQKFLLAPATDREPAQRQLIGTWRRAREAVDWEEL